MKLAFIGRGNLPFLSVAMDTNDDSILNLSALAKYLGVARSTLLDRIQSYGFESALRHYSVAKTRKS